GTKEYRDKVELATQYWNTVATMISDWGKVKNDELKAAELRQEKINAHAVVLRALGGLGKSLIESYPKEWKQRLTKLKDIDWRKSIGNKVNPMWENACITAGSVVSNRQARVATLAVLKQHVGLELTKQEEQVWGSMASFREAATA
ncbi:DNA sulfur modification protein DndB, partial [bacterium]|nr:DNA sulfur modification protein DndB [bacterium]